MANHGGSRPGAGQPGKPRLTLAELERALTRCAEVRGGRMSAQGIVDAINEERTRGYLDPRSIAKLRVSTWWLRRQTKMLRQSTPASEANLIDSTGTRFPAYHTGSRMAQQPDAGESVWGRSLLNGHVHSFGTDGACRCGAKPFENQTAEVNAPEPQAPAKPAAKVESEQRVVP